MVSDLTLLSMSDFLILTSPPASGKTYWIQNFARAFTGRILVISPLKALALELNEKWGGQILVQTPESYILNPEVCEVVIFDEWHLFFYWGETFREQMWEAFYQLAEHTALCVGLTATLNKEIQERMNHWGHFERILWVDHGNHQLKYRPEQLVRLPSEAFHHSLIRHSVPHKTQIIFCEFRQEVEEWVERLSALGWVTLGCVGGETASFVEKLKQRTPHFIVATTCLSHGVNLPTIDVVHFFYEVKNLDFWIQMLARGGRDGSSFIVYTTYLPKEVKVNFWTNLGINFKLKVWFVIQDFILGLDEWFLKASSLEKLPTKKGI